MTESIAEFVKKINIRRGSILKARVIAGGKRRHSSDGNQRTYVYDSKCGIYTSCQNTDTIPLDIVSNLPKKPITTLIYDGLVGDIIIEHIKGDFEEEGRHVKVGGHGHPFRVKGRPCICYEDERTSIVRVEQEKVSLNTK